MYFEGLACTGWGEEGFVGGWGGFGWGDLLLGNFMFYNSFIELEGGIYSYGFLTKISVLYTIAYRLIIGLLFLLSHNLLLILL